MSARTDLGEQTELMGSRAREESVGGRCVGREVNWEGTLRSPNQSGLLPIAAALTVRLTCRRLLGDPFIQRLNAPSSHLGHLRLLQRLLAVCACKMARRFAGQRASVPACPVPMPAMRATRSNATPSRCAPTAPAPAVPG